MAEKRDELRGRHTQHKRLGAQSDFPASSAQESQRQAAQHKGNRCEIRHTPGRGCRCRGQVPDKSLVNAKIDWQELLTQRQHPHRADHQPGEDARRAVIAPPQAGTSEHKAQCGIELHRSRLGQQRRRHLEDNQPARQEHQTDSSDDQRAGAGDASRAGYRRDRIRARNGRHQVAFGVRCVPLARLLRADRDGLQGVFLQPMAGLLAKKQCSKPPEAARSQSARAYAEDLVRLAAQIAGSGEGATWNPLSELKPETPRQMVAVLIVLH